MKRILILLTAMSIGTLMVLACGGGGGGGGNDTSAVLRAVAIFTDTNYVDYIPGDDEAEASNLEAALRDMGHTVTPFTGIAEIDWSSALSGKNVLVIPELEIGPLDSDISSEARSAVSDFVNNGGILFANLDRPSDDQSLDFLNTTFGYSMADTESLSAGEILSYSSTEASGTGFEGAVPMIVPAHSLTVLIDPATVPSSGKIIYTSPAGNAALIYIPKGDGHIVISGWDWYGGKPVGSDDGGWWGVLYRAVSLNADHNDACVLYTGPDGQGSDVAQRLRESGQFGDVDTFDAESGTPTLAQLNAYDSILVYAYSNGYADSTALGNVVADYVDGGGGAVLGLYSFYTLSAPDWSLMGRFASDDYYALPGDAQDVWGSETLDTIFYDAHPTMAGVQTLDVNAYADTLNVNTGATRIAEYSGGSPIIATREIGGVRRADLGLLPDIYDGYDDDTDGGLLIANALTWTADLAEPDYLDVISADSFPMPIGSPVGLNCSATSTLTVSGGPESISKVTVSMDIAHSYLVDLDITLESPEGTILDISSDNGSTGDDYSNVTFDDAAGNGIGDLLSSIFTPFTGSYMPEEALASLQGEDSNGTWTLHIADDWCGEDGGVGLNSWSVMVR